MTLYATLELARRRAVSGQRRAALRALALGAIALAEGLRHMHFHDQGGRAAIAGWACTCAALAGAWLALGAPFRVLLARDLAPLAALPVRGGDLTALAARRTLAALGAAALALGPPLALALATGAGPRLGALATAALGVGASLGLLGALGGGAVAVDPRLRGALSGGAREGQAPDLAWATGPAVAAAAAAGYVALAGRAWAAGAPELPLGAGALALAALIAAAAVPALGRATLPRTVRALASADRERLAHVERVGPSAAERAAARLLRSPAARRLLDKDATLLRRRYPMVGYLLGADTLALAACALVRPDGYDGWAIGLGAGAMAYAAWVGPRLWREPVEHPRALDALPVGERAAGQAKRVLAATRALIPVALGAALALARAPDPVALAAPLGGALALGALVPLARRRPTDPGSTR